VNDQHDDHQLDPLDVLAEPNRQIRPPAAFVRDLRARLLDALGADTTNTIELPERKSTMSTGSTNTSTSTTPPQVGTALAVPYLAVRGGAAALDWYADAFGAVEAMRVVGDDGRIGHAEISIGGATFYLSDEYPEIGVDSPDSAGGTTVTLHLTVERDVDAVFARAVDAGATSLSEPADQPHGSRHGTLTDPFGHRWMLSQQIEQIDIDTYRERAAEGGFRVEAGAATATPKYGQIWAAMPYADAPAGIRFLTDVLGFEEQIVVPSPDDPAVIEHSQLRWPEGGILQASTANRPGNPYSARPIGSESLYVVTADPLAVWERCQAAGVEVLDPPSTPDYAPGTMTFSIRDPEGNIFTFGSYAGEA
jgi:PhnB protein